MNKLVKKLLQRSLCTRPTRRRKTHHARSLSLESLAARELLAGNILGGTFESDGEDWSLSYEIADENVGAFNVGIDATENGSTTRLQTFRISNSNDLAVGTHAITVAPDFNDLNVDYALVAKWDADDEVIESNESDNTSGFDEGVFLSEDDVVYVHGSDDDDSINLFTSGSTLYVIANGQSNSFNASTVGVVRIRVHDGNDGVVASAVGTISMWAFGGDGNDSLSGGDGDDWLHGNDGDDWAYGGYGDDSLDGGSGDDELDGDEGDDAFYGGAGNDTIIGGAGSDDLDGGDGDDVMIGGSGSDTLIGGAGNDDLTGDAGNDSIYGDAGADWLQGGDGDDFLDGGDDSDLISGDSGNDAVYGGSAADFILTDWNDSINYDPLDTLLDDGTGYGYGYGYGAAPEIIDEELDFVGAGYGGTWELTGAVNDDVDPTGLTVVVGGLVSDSTTVDTDDNFAFTLSFGTNVNGWLTIDVTDGDGNAAKTKFVRVAT